MSDDHDDMISRGECGGRACVVMQFIYTAALLTDYESNGWTYDYTERYCYPSVPAALAAMRAWDGAGDPPGPWIKEKVSERLGPGAIDP
jgi:hypothetical protein